MNEENLISISNKNKNKKYKTIAIAGAGRRVGTTTQALLITQFLQLNLFKACYIQVNRTHFAEQVASVYNDSVIDRKNNLVVYKDIDMYITPKVSNDDIKKIISNTEYDYYIIDFGNSLERNFPTTSFIDKDYNLIVTGSKPNEILLLDLAKQKIGYNNIKILFSFTPEQDKPKLLKYLGLDEDENKLFIIPYNPNYFEYGIQNTKNYNDIFKVSLKKQFNKNIKNIKSIDENSHNVEKTENDENDENVKSDSGVEENCKGKKKNKKRGWFKWAEKKKKEKQKNKNQN